MNLYAIEFREKRSKEVNTALILADSEELALQDFWKHRDVEQGVWDVDRRTVKWGASSLPLKHGPGVLFLINQKIED